MSKKKDQWLKQIKIKAESQKSLSVGDVLTQLDNPQPAVKTRHPIIWITLGAIATLSINVFFDTVYENRKLRAELIQTGSPFKKTTFTKTTNTNTSCSKSNVENTNSDNNVLLELPPKYDDVDMVLPNLDFELIKI